MTRSAVEPLLSGDPQALGPYRLLARLREGPSGVVYLGQAGGGTPVDVRTIQTAERGRPGFAERLDAQVEAVRQVARFGLAPVIDADLDATLPYLVSEHVDGPSLEALVAERGPFAPGSLEGLAIGVARALVAVHQAGTVHGDLRPALVVLSDVGVRVVDFGIAPTLELTVGLTAMTPHRGTAAFVAPEQHLGGPATAAADVYAWGALLAFAATGRPPFGAGSDATVAYRAIHGIPDLSALPRGLRELVAAAMAPDPAARPSATDLLERLTGGPATLPPAAKRRRRRRHAGRTPAEARRARRRAGLAAGVIAALVASGLATGGVTWAVARPRGPDLRPWNPPAGVAPNPVAADDFSRLRDWEEIRRDESEGAAEVEYADGRLRARTSGTSVMTLGPKVVVSDLVFTRTSGTTGLTHVHQAVDVAWTGGSRWGAVALECGNEYDLRFHYDGTAVVMRTGFGESGDLVLAKGRPRLADLAGPRRLEGTCEVLPGRRSARLAAWVNGVQVATATDRRNDEITGILPSVGVLSSGGAEADVLVDNFVVWINP